MQNIIFTTAACTQKEAGSLLSMQSLCAANSHQKPLTHINYILWEGS